MDGTTSIGGRPEVIDLISIVFEPELVLLEIQARSIELYFPTEKIANIIVVVNDNDSVAEKINKSWWGINQHKVKIIPRSTIGNYSFLHGWSSQQLCKLFAASKASSKWSLCLDSKTWLVQKLDWEKLFDDSGKVNFKSFTYMPVFDAAKQFTEKFFSIEFTDVIGPGGVPFAFHTDSIRHMIKHVEEKTDNDFFEFFANSLQVPNSVTEFIFYSGYIFSSNQYHSLYSNKQHYSITNLADWQIEHFDDILNQMSSANNLTASIQGRAYPLLTELQFNRWLDFLLSKQLITNRENTKILLNTLRQSSRIR
jgi:hypothetical protein